MQTERDLKKLEPEIRRAVRQHSSDDILLAIHNAQLELTKDDSPGHRFFPLEQGGFRPFVGAGIAAFSILHSNPYRDRRRCTLGDLAKLAGLVSTYLLADPISFDETIHEEFKLANPLFAMLRIAAGQFPFEVNLFGWCAQPLILYDEMPRRIGHKEGITGFDFDTAFQKLTGMPLKNFIEVGFVAWAASGGPNGFTREYFNTARGRGIVLPDDKAISEVLEQVAADPIRFREEYEKRKEKDRRFRMYDFNPLLAFPIVRPWRHHQRRQMDRDRMVAPIPDLVAHRCSSGIFYQMFNAYGVTFSEYFGQLFEAYVGEILRQSVPTGSLYSEEDIRRTYAEKCGKVPDWIEIDGATAILIECKATRFSRAALAAGGEPAINDSMRQVLKGLIQLHKFSQALQARTPGLEMFYHCTSFKPILVSYEPLHLINTSLFRQHLDQLLGREGVINLPWHIISLKELEVLQPHLRAGVRLAEITQKMGDGTFALDELAAATGKTYKDSFLYAYDEEMYRRLGATDRR